MFPHGFLILLVYVTVPVPAGDAPVVAAEVYLASDLSRPVHSTEVEAGARDVTLPLSPGLDAAIVLRRHDGLYYLHGPMRWPAEDRTILVSHAPGYTVEGAVPGHSGTELTLAWTAASGSGAAEPLCRISANLWRCVGVPASDTGVVVLATGPLLRFAVTRPPASGGFTRLPVRTARWATMVSLEGDPADVEGTRVRVLAPRPVRSRAHRSRVLLEPAARVTVERLTSGVWLAAGAEQRDDLLLQADGERVALTRIPLAAAGGSLDRLPLLVTPAVPLAGRVVDRGGRGAEGARLAVAELAEERTDDGRNRIVRRQVTELESGADGVFVLAGLGPGRFELLGLHPRLGRGTLVFEPGPRPLLLRLDPGTRVKGRVVRGGVPAGGVWIDVPASHEGYLAAPDPMDVLAPAVSTGPDGRFELVLPRRGATELRIDDRGVVTRVALSNVAGGSVLDLGDIALRGSIAVRATYVGDERCALLAAGPLGHTGMTLVEGQAIGRGLRLLTLPEPGRWLLELRCPRGAARAEPPVVDVPAQVAEWSVHVMMAPP
jgi:hypothetical protein